MQRYNQRSYNSLRNIDIQTNVNLYADGSCLMSIGNTKVLCTASIDNKVPHFAKATGSGWISAEYGMLPHSTGVRMEREAYKGKQSGRTQEIQRLIGRSLRSVVDLKKLGEKQIKIDCDVIQADGGTRVASICGGYVALFLALQKSVMLNDIMEMPIIEDIAGISCGIYKNEVILDLDYNEDSNADADANFVITSSGKLVEVQVSAEKKTISKEEFAKMWHLAEIGTIHLINEQRKAILNALKNE